jgi:polygalacturonase
MFRVGKAGVPVVLLVLALAGIGFAPFGSSAGPGDQPGFLAPSQSCMRQPGSDLVVDVRDKGATPDDGTDDTAAIQAAIDAVAGSGGTVLVPDGVYLVDAVGKHRLKLKSRMTLSLAPGATLKAKPNDAEGYAVLSISGASDVTVVGGTLEGDRHEHVGTTGEWGMGVRIDGGAKRITLSGVTARHMWGDGFYVHGANGVLLCSVTADHNRRQGLSVIAVDGLVVAGSVFKNTAGTRPGSGIDLEPDQTTEAIANVRIQDSQFLNNVGPGLLIDGGKGPISNVEITNNAFAGNPRSIKLKHAPDVSARCGNEIVSQDSAWTDFSALVETVTYAVTPNACSE